MKQRKNKFLTLCVYCALVLIGAGSLTSSEVAWSKNECGTSRHSHWADWQFFGVQDLAMKKWIVTCNSETYTGTTYTTPDQDGNRFPISGPGNVYHERDGVPSSFWDEINYRSGFLLETDGSIGPGDTRYDNFLSSTGGGKLPPGASTGARIWLPKRYTRSACQQVGNNNKMCFVVVDRVVADPEGQLYWRLKNNNGDLGGTQTNGEFVDDSTNDNVFIPAESTRRTLGVTEEELVIDGVSIQSIFNRYDSQGRPLSTSRNDDRWSGTVDVRAGTAFSPTGESLDHTITVKGGATITGGALYLERIVNGRILRDAMPGNGERERLTAISLKVRNAEHVGRLTVNVVDGMVRTYRSLSPSAATPAQAIFVGSSTISGTEENPNQAIVKLQDKGKVAVRDANVMPGKITTSGDYSTAIWASATSATTLGSIRINTPLEITTAGDESHGIRVQSGTADALARATRNRAIAAGEEGAWSWSGFNFGTLFFHAAGGGHPSADTINELTRADMIGAFELENGMPGPRVEHLRSGDNQFLSHIVAALKDRNVITDEVIAEAKRLNFLSSRFLYGPYGILGRIRSSSNTDGFIVEINDDADTQAGIATSGPYATAIKGESSGNLSTIWIGSRGDFEGDERSVAVDHDGDSDTEEVMTYRTRVVVDRPITTTGARSHGVFVQLTDERSIGIEVASTITAGGEGSKAIMIDTIPGSANTISIGSAGSVQGDIQIGAGTNRISGTGSIYGTIMGTMGGTLTTLDLEDSTRASSIGLHSSLDITGDVMLGSGDDTVTIKGISFENELNLGEGDNRLVAESGMISGAIGVYDLVKSTSGVATISALEVSNDLIMEAGELRLPRLSVIRMRKSTSGVATMVGDVSIMRSLTIEAGELRISGHLNLGSAGTATISDGTLLTFLATRGTNGELSHGRLTADAIYFFSSEPNVRISNADGSDLSNDDALTVLSGALGAGTRVLSLSGGFVAREVSVRAVHSNSGNSIGRLETQPPDTDSSQDVQTGSLVFDEGDDDVVLVSDDMVASVDLGAGTNTLTSNQEAALTSIASSSAAGDSTTIQLNSGRVTAGMTFGAGDDTLRWVESVSVGGNIDLGDGTNVVNGGAMDGGRIMGGAGLDTVTLRSGSVESITGVETFTKLGTGTLRIGYISNEPRGAATLSGSPTAAGDAITVNVNRGKLVVSGHLNLRPTGTLTVKEGATLAFVVTGAGTQTPETATHGRITAESVVFEGESPEVERIAEVAGTRAADLAAATRSRLFIGGTSTEDDEGNDVTPTLTVGEASPRPTRIPAATGADDDNTGLYAAGAIAVIWWLMCETGVIGSMSDNGGSTCFGKSQWNSGGAAQYRSTGMNSWARLQSDKGTNPVQGLAFGTDVHVDEKVRIGFSAMPNASGSAGSFGASLNRKSSISGGLYSLQSEWGGDTGYASAALTHANLTAGTQFENIVSGGGMLGGEFKMRQSHLQLTAGSRLEAGNVSLSPSMGLYGGTVDQNSYSASNAALVAKVPGYRLNYRGWKLGLRAESKEVMSGSGGLKWSPDVSVDMYRTATNGPSSLRLNQIDRTGSLNLSDDMLVDGLPKSIVALRAGGAIELPRAGQLRMDYVGMEMDGEVHHGALLKYQNQF